MKEQKLVLRQTTSEDIDSVLNLYTDAQKRFADQKINQWQDNYPNIETLKRDMDNNESYVVVCEKEIVATVMLSGLPEPTYQKIEGKWLTPDETPYMVIHRMVVKSSFLRQGIARYIFDKSMQMCNDLHLYSIRVDTHKDNQSMSGLLKKKGFVYCGVIYAHDGTERDAFEFFIRRRYVM